MTIEEILQGALAEPASLPHPIHEAAWVDPKTLPFSAAVREACAANFCGNYGKCWVCPPGCGEWEVLREHFRGYAHAFVFTTKHDLEDSFDYEGMTEGRIRHKHTENELEKRLRENGLSFEMAGAGGCGLCATCAYPEPCRHPDRMRRSMEASGMDVVTLAREAGIHYINGANTVTYFTVILW